MIIHYRGIAMVPINDAARLTDRSVQTIRYLIEDRIGRKGMAHFRDGCHIYIPLAVLQGYHYGEPGVISPIGHAVYHFIDNGAGGYRKTFCKECTYTKEGCALSQEAERVAKEVNSWL